MRDIPAELLFAGMRKVNPRGHSILFPYSNPQIKLESLGGSMDEQDFEGTLVLEKLAMIDKVDDFFEAVDSDDLQKAASLMKRANVDSETIAIVLKKMADADGQHECSQATCSPAS